MQHNLIPALPIDEFDNSDGSYEPCEHCGYPIYRAYNYAQHSETENWYPVDVALGGSQIYEELETCPQCGKELCD